MDSPRVSVIVLNWNGLEDTIECLESLHRIDYPNFEVIVVDNGSTGDDVQVLGSRFEGFARIIANSTNYGFAEGNNIGIRHALKDPDTAYVLLLNNDTVVAPDFMTALVNAAESEEDIGIVSPKVYYYDFSGSADVIWFAGGGIQWYRRCVCYHLGKEDRDQPRYQRAVTVDWVTGAAMMIKRSTLDTTGLLSVQYFFGMEDVEYCLRARKSGLRSVYVPEARVWHKVGRSRGTMAPSLAELRAYYLLVRRNFSGPVYLYQLMLLPVHLCRGAIAYATGTGLRALLGTLQRGGRGRTQRDERN